MRKEYLARFVVNIDLRLLNSVPFTRASGDSPSVIRAKDTYYMHRFATRAATRGWQGAGGRGGEEKVAWTARGANSGLDCSRIPSSHGRMILPARCRMFQRDGREHPKERRITRKASLPPPRRCKRERERESNQSVIQPGRANPRSVY